MGTKVVIFTVPISEGRVVTIKNLPNELSKADAEQRILK